MERWLRTRQSAQPARGGADIKCGWPRGLTRPDGLRRSRRDLQAGDFRTNRIARCRRSIQRPLGSDPASRGPADHLTWRALQFSAEQESRTPRRRHASLPGDKPQRRRA